MNKRVRYFSIFLLALVNTVQATVTDDAGREINLPGKIHKVYAAGPPAAILLYTLAPELLAGWDRLPRDDEIQFIAPQFRGLPALGRLTGRGNTANTEIVLRSGAQLILDYGAIKPVYQSLAERVQQQTGIPYLLMDGDFAKITNTFRRLGTILDRLERGELLARYTEKILSQVTDTLAKVPESQRPRVYYGRGPDGLQTGAGGSINVEFLRIVGAKNVAADAGGDRRGLIEVSMEQILLWDPQVVLTLDANFYHHARNDPLWSRVNAVRNGRVHLAPRFPFGWIDRPPSVNRLLGLPWLLHVLYPDQSMLDIRKTTREFYQLFYHVELSESQLDQLLFSAL